MRRLYLICALLLVLAAAAPAQAAVVMAPLKPCYVSDGDAADERERIDVLASGFTPLATLTLLIDNQPIDTGMADAFGNVSAHVPAPFQGFGERAFTLVIREDLNPTVNFATATALVSNLGVTLRPRRTQPSKRIRFRGRGFTIPDAPVFGHYLHGGKVVKTVRFARRPGGACGTFRARRRQIPVRRPATGLWTLQVDQQRRYAARPASNAQRVFIRVRATFVDP